MKMDLTSKFSLEGRGAVIMGAGSGIGRQAAVTFADAGARLVLADRDGKGLAETVKMVSEAAPSVASMELDVSDRSAVEACAALAAKQACVDVWANVAGIIGQFSIAEAKETELNRIVDINMKGVYWGCSAAARLMTAAGRGSIINISSSAADGAYPGLSAYSLSKAAINSITRVLANEVGHAGVRVNAVAPGFVDTPIVTYRFAGADGALDERARDELFARRAAGTALKRVGTPEDIALCMLFLASDASSFFTGQVLRPDGGMTS
jgi:3-oxoacyl-[acyl-carrier protein] reductase